MTDDYSVLGVMGPGAPELLGWTDVDRSRPRAPATVAGRRGARHPDDVRRRARLGADRPGRARARRSTTRCRPVARWTPATTRWSRCGWRRATARSARELTPDYTPVEAGLVFATALQGRQGLPRPRRPRGAPRRGSPRAVRAGGSSRSWLEDARADAVGRRAAAARRRAGRPGDQRRLGRDRRRRGRARLPARRRTRSPPTRSRASALRGRRRRGAVRRACLADGARWPRVLRGRSPSSSSTARPCSATTAVAARRHRGGAPTTTTCCACERHQHRHRGRPPARHRRQHPR